MPVVISGSDGISGIVGSASTPAVRGSSGDSGIHFDANAVNVSVGGSTRVRFDGSGNVNVSGILTASSVTATGLSGSPSISVSGINNTGVSTSIDFRLSSVAEKTTIVNGNTVNLVYNTGGGNVAICTNPSGNITLNVTGIPTSSNFDNNSLSFSVIVQNTGTARSCTAITLNGVPETILWFGGSLSAALSGVTTSTGYDIYSFVGINTVGSASTALNYIVLGNVNGGYR